MLEFMHIISGDSIRKYWSRSNIHAFKVRNLKGLGLENLNTLVERNEIKIINNSKFFKDYHFSDLTLWRKNATFGFSLCALIHYGYAHEYKEEQKTLSLAWRYYSHVFFSISNHYLFHHWSFPRRNWNNWHYCKHEWNINIPNTRQ